MSKPRYKHWYNHKTMIKFTEEEWEMLRQVAYAQGRNVSSFVREAARRELARLGFLNEDETKALLGSRLAHPNRVAEDVQSLLSKGENEALLGR